MRTQVKYYRSYLFDGFIWVTNHNHGLVTFDVSYLVNTVILVKNLIEFKHCKLEEQNIHLKSELII